MELIALVAAQPVPAGLSFGLVLATAIDSLAWRVRGHPQPFSIDRSRLAVALGFASPVLAPAILIQNFQFVGVELNAVMVLSVHFAEPDLPIRL